MNSYSTNSILRKGLIDWYKEYKRDLPWRHTINPYQIWISEIILQQTRIDQGLSYYERFISDFPDVASLAAAPLEKVLKDWQGLGYYSRARNLHETAKRIVSDFGGQFPDNYEQLLKLKGIGTYTAAAIASFAYKQPHAVLDGNVFRVLSRLFLIDTPIYSTKGKKEFAALAETLLDPDQPDTYNQAIMDFGALQCTPSNPGCENCPLSALCLAYKAGCTTDLPVRKITLPKQDRYFYYLVCHDSQQTWLKERTAKDIWQHLWEFPLVETEQEIAIDELLGKAEVVDWIGQSSTVHTIARFRHVLSHQIIHATFIPVSVTNITGLSGD
ncbi:MAG: A/G-specific adenine glycosylase, partial [Bacteroidota bacterium]|nr:A/G-specific adenine glycosylase [Bacteroidota bacterium]